MMKKLLSLLSIIWLTTTLNAQRLLTIEEMFSLAEQNNSSVLEFAAGEEAASEDVLVAKNDRLPSIEAGLALSYIGDGWMSDRDFSNGKHIDMPHFGNDFVVSATQVIYAGGAISKNVEMAELREQIAHLKSEDNMQNVRFLLIGYYLGIYQLRNEEIVYRRNIEQTEMLVDEITAAYGQGVALKSDITRYRLQLEDLKLGLTETINDKKILNRELCTAIGIDPATIIEVDTTLLDREFLVEAEQYWMDLVEDSPQMKVVDKGVELSNKAVRLAKAEKLPSIALTAGDNFNSPILIEVPTLDNNFNYWHIGVGITYNFDNLFKTNKKVRKAKAEATMAAAQRQTAWDAHTNAVHSAYIKLEEAYSRLETREVSLALASENYDEVHYRYLNGLVLVTDMLDGSNTKLKAELDYVNARIGILYQYYLLRKTSGIL